MSWLGTKGNGVQSFTVRIDLRLFVLTDLYIFSSLQNTNAVLVITKHVLDMPLCYSLFHVYIYG